MHFINKRALKWVLCGIIAVCVLAFCAWVFGWFSDTIDVIDFDADEVSSVELSSTIFAFDDVNAVTVTDKGEIREMIDGINSFQNTGNTLKDLWKGIGLGGTALYIFTFQLENGEPFEVTFGSNDGGESPTDMKLGYWTSRMKTHKIIGNTCRGSMEFFFDLHDKYSKMETK